MLNPENNPKPQPRISAIIFLRVVVGLAVSVFIVILGLILAAYLSTPSSIRKPTNTHSHFRMDLIVAGKPVSFEEEKYQTDYRSDICSSALTKQPVHFHDHDKQFVHLHWGDITGGQVLKDYGWNFLGGLQNTLGWRFDTGNVLKHVATHGNNLPARASGDNYYIYVGGATVYKERNWSNFLHDPLLTFFQTTIDTPTNIAQQSSDESKLAKLNNVIGSAVIFVQKDRPTDAQIKDRFNHLEPLPESQCAG